MAICKFFLQFKIFQEIGRHTMQLKNTEISFRVTHVVFHFYRRAYVIKIGSLSGKSTGG